MTRKNYQQGFAHIMMAVLIAVILVAGGTGYYVWHRNHKSAATNTAKTSDNAAADTFVVGLVTFKHASNIPASARNEILTKVANPLAYYDNTDLKSRVTAVEVDLALAPDNKTRSAQYGYNVTETQGKTLLSSFAIGDTGKIDYWFPDLCDDGGCRSYPADFKAKYPANYQAYLNGNTGKKTGQKYLIIKEWGVRVAYGGNDVLSYVWDPAGQTTDATIISANLAARYKDCAAFGAGQIARLTPGETLYSGGPTAAQAAAEATYSVEFSHVGNYYYFFQHDDATCTDASSAGQKAQNAANDTVKALVHEFKAAPANY